MKTLFLNRNEASSVGNKCVSFTSINDNVREMSYVESGKVLITRSYTVSLP